MLQSRSVIRNSSFEIESNSGEKEDHHNDYHNIGSSIKFKGSGRFLDFNDTEDHVKKYNFFNISSNKESFDALK